MSGSREPDTETDGDELVDGPAPSGNPTDRPEDGNGDTEHKRSELRRLAADLERENRRLRREYTHARRGEYRRSALALLTLGTVSVVGGFLLPVVREVLFVLGAAGLFAGALTWYLTPERLVTATVGRSVYESVVHVGTALREELGLESVSLYVPTDGMNGTSVGVKLFVPRSDSHSIPPADELRSLFVLPEDESQRGIALRPTAAELVGEFERSMSGELASEPLPLAEQLVDGLVEEFELVDEAAPAVDVDSRRVSVSVDGDVYDRPAGFDNPTASFLATGMAVGLDRPIRVETSENTDETLVTCWWL